MQKLFTSPKIPKFELIFGTLSEV